MTFTEQDERHLWGGCQIFEDDPVIRERSEVYYLPFVQNGHWGVFDAENNIVLSTIDRWMPQQLPMGQIFTSNIRPSDVTERLPAGPQYIYGGRYTDHFGHFVIETLPRLWPLAEEGLRPGQKLIMHGDGSPDWWWRHDYVREVMGALNIRPEDIIASDRPFTIDRLTIPRASFGAQDFAHRAFSRLCRSIGEKLLEGWEPVRDWTPAYWSKTRLKHGVRRFENEPAIIEVMEREGVEIVYPEQVSFAGKLKMISSRNVITGSAMSAHHASVFTQGASRFEMLSPASVMNSNFVIIDRLNGNRARYYYPDGVREIRPADPTFLVYYELEDPAAVARELLTKL